MILLFVLISSLKVSFESNASSPFASSQIFKYHINVPKSKLPDRRPSIEVTPPVKNNNPADPSLLRRFVSESPHQKANKSIDLSTSMPAFHQAS